MKCTNNNIRQRRIPRKKWGEYKRKQRRKRIILGVFFLFMCILGIVASIFLINNKVVTKYENETYSNNIYKEKLTVDQLCVVSDDIAYDKFETEDEFHAAGLFDLQERQVLFAENVHERLFPASTTKVLTTYIALKYGELSDIVTVGEAAMNVPWDSSKAWLQLGDQLTLEDLLYALMLPSGNDAAAAIAEHISGSEEAFADLMNEEAAKLGMSHSHFVNAHGYQDEEHYTTAYDLYLVLNQCIQNETFIEIVSSSSHHAKITQADGTVRNMTWKQSNQFINGTTVVPDGVIVLGGKTGTTDEAGACLVLCVTDENSNPYISIIMGAEAKAVLYENMGNLISTIK